MVPGRMACDSCAGAWRPLALYLAANFLMNVFMTGMLKTSGSTTMFAVMTVRMPMQAMAFSLPALMGAAAKPFSSSDVVSLVVICTGIVIFKSSPDAASLIPAETASVAEPAEGEGKKKKSN
jgi:hypothetical protein